MHTAHPTATARRRLALLALLALLLGSAAWAAPPLEVARGAFAAAAQRLDALSGARARLAAEHEAVAARIEALKSAGAGRLLPGVTDGRLDELLKAAQGDADRLAELDRQHAAAAAEQARHQRALMEALGEQLLALQAQTARAAPAERPALFAQLRALAAEQAQVARAGAAPARPQGGLPRVDAAALEDASPDELLELADEALDHAERVRRQLAEVEQRLDALRERRRILRAAVAFRRDESLFAEGERNRVIVRGDGPAPGRGVSVGGGNPGAGVPPGDGATAGPPVSGGGQSPSTGSPAEPGGAGAADGDAEGAPESPGRGGDDFSEPPPQAGVDNGVDPGVTAPPPVAEPAGFGDAFGPTPVGGTGGVDQALDPALFAGGVEDLSPRGIARQIAAHEAHRKALAASAAALEARRKALEARARSQEQR